MQHNPTFTEAVSRDRRQANPLYGASLAVDKPSCEPGAPHLYERLDDVRAQDEAVGPVLGGLSNPAYQLSSDFRGGTSLIGDLGDAVA